MHLGPLIRRLFGPYERQMAEGYRRMFVDLEDFAELMKDWVPSAQNILEVGCGEGAMTERIVRLYPDAEVTAIDITPRIGRLYRGSRSTVIFRKETVEELSLRAPAQFDLVVLADIVHHVPSEARASLMQAIDRAIAPEGVLILKDWVTSATPIHWICEFLERHVTGDSVSYLQSQGLSDLLDQTFGLGTIRLTGTVRPWNNNLVFLAGRPETHVC